MQGKITIKVFMCLVLAIVGNNVFSVETVGNWKVGGYTRRGKRDYNEDRFVVQQLSDNNAAVAVYDGSQGPWLSEGMCCETKEMLKRKDLDLSDGKKIIEDLFVKGERLSRAVNKDHYEQQEKHDMVPESEFPYVPYAIIRSKNDPFKLMQCSTTAAMALLHGNKCHIGWVGDTRVVIGNKVSREVVYATTDHKPTEENEKGRLLDLQQQLYGNSEIADGESEEHILQMIDGALKIEGLVMVSRAIGCNMFKESVIMEPEFFEYDMQENNFLIVACDGVWDVMTSEEAVGFVSERLDKGMALEQISKELVAEAIIKGSLDNVTACVISSIDMKQVSNMGFLARNGGKIKLILCLGFVGILCYLYCQRAV